MTPAGSAAAALRRMGRELLRAAARRRWLLAGGLVAAAVATALPLLAPGAGPATAVLAAARDLAAGSVLTEGDLTRVRLPPGAVPDGALPDDGAATGRRLAGAVRRGEALTDARLVGPGLLARLPADGSGAPDGSAVAVPVRLADAASAALLRPGDRVDVLAAPTAAGSAGAGPPGTVGGAGVVAAGALVLSVPAVPGDPDGGLVVLATSPSTATRLAGAAVTSRLSVALRP